MKWQFNERELFRKRGKNKFTTELFPGREIIYLFGITVGFLLK